MSKNSERYKVDLTEIANEELDELDGLDIKKFERIHTKKEKSPKKKAHKQLEFEELD